MRQYAQNTTGATFEIIDYGTSKYGPHGNKRINVVYTDGKTFIRSVGWYDFMYDAVQRVRTCADMYGVKLAGKRERVA